MRLDFFVLFIISGVSRAFIFNFNQQQQQQQPKSYEESVLDNQCGQYLCPDTQACVASPNECPCPFPNSQLRCVLPNNNYVCISKPATHDQKLTEIYDDPLKGSQAHNSGLRDCGWVLEAYAGKL